MRMREIKFRVWDTQLYVMLTAEKDEELGDAYEPLWNLKCVRGGRVSYPLGVIMEFTGLKDKNGKDIYEGDILRGYGEIKYYIVSFENGSFVLHHQFARWGLLYRMFEVDMKDMDPEVIGNIYENPELIEQP